MKTSINQSLWISAAASLLALACSPANPQLMTPQKSYAEMQAIAPYNYSITAPKLDVLFVIDNSLSMDKHILQLSENGKAFALAMAKYRSLDVHIGVVSIADHKTTDYFHGRPASCLPVGKLRPLVDPKCPGIAVPGPSYVTSTTGDKPLCAASAQATASDPSAGFASILSETLKLPIELAYEKAPEGDPVGRIGPDGKLDRALCGAEYEEVFSPIMAALSQSVNPGFSRPDAYLAVVMMTDMHGGADDSVIDPVDLAAQLLNFKNGRQELVSTYAALVLKPGPNCSADDSGTAGKIPALLKMTGGNAPYDMCTSDFGAAIAKKLEALARTAVFAHTFFITINGDPDLSTMRVYVGDREVFQKNGDWTYDGRTHRLTLSQALLANTPPGTNVRVSDRNVDLKDILAGRIAAPASP